MKTKNIICVLSFFMIFSCVRPLLGESGRPQGGMKRWFKNWLILPVPPVDTSDYFDSDAKSRNFFLRSEYKRKLDKKGIAGEDRKIKLDIFKKKKSLEGVGKNASKDDALEMIINEIKNRPIDEIDQKKIEKYEKYSRRRGRKAERFLNYDFRHSIG